MKGVILSAGRSTRTYPITLTRPKPLLSVAGKTIIERNIETIAGIVDSLVIIIGYKAEMITEALGSEFNNLPIEYVEQRVQDGSGGAVLLVEDMVGDEFVVINGDDLYSPEDIKAVACECPSVLLHSVDNISRFGSIEIEDGVITEIVESPGVFKSGLVNAGAYHFDGRVFEILRRLPPGGRGEYELPQALIISEYRGMVKAVIGEGYWRPVGYPWDYLLANLDFSQRESGSVIHPETDIHPEAVITSSVVMRGARIGRRAIISYSVIGEDVVIGDEVKISDVNKQGGTVNSFVKGEMVDTGLYNVGAFIGDGAVIEEEAMIEAGVKIWPRVVIPAGVVVSEDVIV